jgi:hypothetical protein
LQTAFLLSTFIQNGTMKKLFFLLFLISTKAMAQMPQADMFITGAGQPLYLEMPGIKNNKVTYIRETAYAVDTTTRQANMQKIQKITVYSIGYFGTTPLLVKLMAVMGTDTTKLVRNEAYNYNPSNGLLMGYQSASDDGGFQSGAAGQVARDANGIITGKATAVTFDLKQPAKPTDYKVMCSGGTGTNVRSVILKSVKDGKDVVERLDMDYDDKGKLFSAVFASPDSKNSDKTTLIYNDKGLLKERQWAFTHQTTEYIPATEGFATFGAWVPGTKASTITKMVTDTSITAFEYDAQGRALTISYSYKGKLSSKDFYTYSSNGLPEMVKTYDDKGRLTELKKFICQ